MLKPIPITCLCMCASLSVFSQTEWFNGRIIEANGSPIAFATVTINANKHSITAKADGSFIIKALPKDSILIDAVNFIATAFAVQKESNAVYILSAVPNTLPTVVVSSAFDTKKEKQSTPYSAQLISSETINIIPQQNLNDALVGKIPGVQFRTQSGAKLNSQSFARVRGGLLLGGDAPPLFVVDGTVVPDGSDIDPSIVDNITILKGANATALFGGSFNGAIVITTKKAKQNKVSIQFSQSVMTDKVGRMPALQNMYAGGASSSLLQYTWQHGHPEEWKALDGKYFNDYTDDASWGPKMEGQEYVPWYSWVPGHQYSLTTAKLVAQPDNIKDFWETGITSNTNLSFAKSGQGYSTRVSFTKQVMTGIIPNSKSDRNIFSGNLNINVNKFISMGFDFSYNRQVVYGDFNDGFINTTTGNFISGTKGILIWAL